MSPEIKSAMGRMRDRAVHIAVEQARLDGVLAALHDLAGVRGAMAALDTARGRFIARHAAEAAAEGWVV